MNNYFLTLGLSLIFSIPTFTLYFLSFMLLKKKRVHWLLAKCILISISIAGIILTASYLGLHKQLEIYVSYTVTAVITGLLLHIMDNAPE